MPQIWKKYIKPEDEALWECRLEVLAEGRFAITEVVGHQRLKIEVFRVEASEAAELKKRYGGRVEELADAAWQLAPLDTILVKVRDKLIITSTVETEALEALRQKYPGRHLLTIPAELAFGTGDHETTSTCLRFLVDVARERNAAPWNLLDLGTGTGILAIAASMLGAEHAVGWENDPLAVAVAQRNVSAHGLELVHVDIESHDVLSWEPELAQWEVITANMFSEILIVLFPKIRRALKPGGTLIISGILHTQEEETLAAASLAGFTMRDVKRVGKWVTARTS